MIKDDVYRYMCNKYGKGFIWGLKTDVLCELIEQELLIEIEKREIKMKELTKENKALKETNSVLGNKQVMSSIHKSLKQIYKGKQLERGEVKNDNP